MSGGSQNTVTQETVPSWLQPYYTQALQPALGLAQGSGPAYYPGQQVAPLNPVQEQGIQSTVNAASSPSASQSADQMNQFMTSGALMDPSMNPYLQGTFTQAANAVQNQLSSEFAGSGRNITGSLPVQSDEMNNLATQLYGGAYQQGVTATTQNEALAPSIDQGMYLPGQELLQTGGGLQGQTQNLINADVNAWNYNQQLPYNQLSWYSSLLGQNAQPFSGSTSTTTMPNNSAMTGLGGAASGAAIGNLIAPGVGAIPGAALGGLMGLFSSDVRLKKHILRRGQTPAGIPVYSFRYLWDADDAPARIGVMAQDVEQVLPAAVVRDARGFLMVDYSQLR